MLKKSLLFFFSVGLLGSSALAQQSRSKASTHAIQPARTFTWSSGCDGQVDDPNTAGCTASRLNKITGFEGNGLFIEALQTSSVRDSGTFGVGVGIFRDKNTISTFDITVAVVNQTQHFITVDPGDVWIEVQEDQTTLVPTRPSPESSVAKHEKAFKHTIIKPSDTVGGYLYFPDDNEALQLVIVLDIDDVEFRFPFHRRGLNADFVAPDATPPQTVSLQPNTALSPQELFNRLSPSVFVVQALNERGSVVATGSGVAVAPNVVMTNKHVISEGAVWRVIRGGEIWPAYVSRTDPDHDLCLLNVQGLKAPSVLVRNSSTLAVGERVYAIGAPEGLELTLSEGVVSGIREYGEGQVIQTSAPISPGSSGGGLFDAQGRLVGITTFFLEEGQNLNFTLPGEWVQALVAK